MLSCAKGLSRLSTRLLFSGTGKVSVRQRRQADSLARDRSTTWHDRTHGPQRRHGRDVWETGEELSHSFCLEEVREIVKTGMSVVYTSPQKEFPQ